MGLHAVRGLIVACGVCSRIPPAQHQLFMMDPYTESFASKSSRRGWRQALRSNMLFMHAVSCVDGSGKAGNASACAKAGDEPAVSRQCGTAPCLGHTWQVWRDVHDA